MILNNTRELSLHFASNHQIQTIRFVIYVLLVSSNKGNKAKLVTIVNQ